MNEHEARRIAQIMMDAVRDSCARIEIAGSLRRRRPEVHDIELVAIPLQGKPAAERPVFGHPPPKQFASHIDKRIVELVVTGKINLLKNGPRYKKIQIELFDNWVKTGSINVDLFLVLPPAQWGVIHTIRTGPNKPDNNFSQWCVTQRSRGGGLPDGYRVQDGAVWPDPRDESDDLNFIPMPEEMDFLNFLGLGWVEPAERHARWNHA